MELSSEVKILTNVASILSCTLMLNSEGRTGLVDVLVLCLFAP